ncbi:MAG: sulfatase-like hydrolase/transferase [Luteolibacter sp.]
MSRSFLILSFLFQSLHAAPIETSWFTDPSGSYARIYPTSAEEKSNTSVTSWNHPQGGTGQAEPTYAGVSEVSSTGSEIFIRTNGLAFHIMGPWYGENDRLFPNYPTNIATAASFPKSPVTADLPKSLTTLGAIGYFVDGVAMFDTRDAFSYIQSEKSDAGPRTTPQRGDGIWNRDAYVNESPTFDASNAHQARGTHHYHANPPGLRHLLGDSVDYDPATNTYTEDPNGKHSPILGFMFDGLPLYGPYGYSDPKDPSSPVRRMTSGYQMRDGSNGSTDLKSTGRTTLPAWITRNEPSRAKPLTPAQYGPDVDATMNRDTATLGHYLEDYAYLGDLGKTLVKDFDLNEYNVRFCITPEFPGGTWAYFCCIDPAGTPVFPYNISRYFFAKPTGGNIRSLPADREILFSGGANVTPHITSSTPAENGSITLTWTGAEGGTYRIEDTTKTLSASAKTTRRNIGETTVAEEPDSPKFSLTSIAPFDDNGFAKTEITAAPKRNILLLIVDDWGIDSSPLDNDTTRNPGTTFPAMPNFEALAARGVRFTSAYAQPTCAPTRASIITGRFAFRHGIGTPGGANLPASELTLPEIFTATESPYALASFGKWHLGGGDNGPSEIGGWPHFAGILRGGVDDYYDWSKTTNGVTKKSTAYTTTDQVNDTLAFIKSNSEKPWFAWVGFNAPHTPFHNPPENLHTKGKTSVEKSNRTAYEAALEALDAELGRILSSVDLENTHIILIGDNGTPGQVVQAPFDRTHSKGSLFQGGIHVPLVIASPDIAAPGTVSEPTHCVDLFSTILEMAGIDLSAATNTLDSCSLLPLIGGQTTPNRTAVSEQFGNIRGGGSEGRAIISALHPDYKLIAYGDPTAAPVSKYLIFDISTDPNEQSALTAPPETTAPHFAAWETLTAIQQSLAPSKTITPENTGDATAFFLKLPDLKGPAGAPQNMAMAPSSITIGETTATFISRTNPEGKEDRLWIKCTLPTTPGTPPTEATVAFPDNPRRPTGSPRTFTTSAITVAP